MEDDEDVSDGESESDAVYMETRTNALRQRVPSGNGTRMGRPVLNWSGPV